MNILNNCRIDSNLHGLRNWEAELQRHLKIINIYVFLLYGISYGEWIAQKQMKINTLITAC